jgi:very-short-patch-repair endonuclease
LRRATPKAKRYARALRVRRTKAEVRLWESIRKYNLGFKFRQQHPILNYIVDFYSPRKNLVVEVDGDYHLTAEQQSYDAYRTKRIESLGIRVIRFTNEQVFKNLPWVLRKIQEQAGETVSSATLPVMSADPTLSGRRRLWVVGGGGQPGMRASKVNAQAEPLSESA